MVKWNLCSYCGQEKAAWITDQMHGTPRITSFQSYGYVKPPLQQVKQLKAQASNRELFCRFLSRRQQIPPQNQQVQAMEKARKT